MPLTKQTAVCTGMLSALWSKAACVWVSMRPYSSVVANCNLEAFLTRAGDLAQQKQLATWEGAPFIFRQAHEQTVASSSSARSLCRLQVAFLRRVKDHPREWMHPQGPTDAIGDQVSVFIISLEMCQSDKTNKGGGKIV